MTNSNQTVEEKARQVLAAIDRKLWAESFADIVGSINNCPTPESLVETYDIPEKNYSNLLDIIGELKNDPTIEVDIEDFAPGSISFRGDEWVIISDGEKMEEPEKDFNARALCILFYQVHLDEKLETRPIKYCEDCGAELQLQCMNICDCEDD